MKSLTPMFIYMDTLGFLQKLAIVLFISGIIGSMDLSNDRMPIQLAFLIIVASIAIQVYLIGYMISLLIGRYKIKRVKVTDFNKRQGAYTSEYYVQLNGSDWVRVSFYDYIELYKEALEDNAKDSTNIWCWQLVHTSDNRVVKLYSYNKYRITAKMADCSGDNNE